MPGPSPRREGNDEGGPWFSPIDLEFSSLLSMGISITPPRVGNTHDQWDIVYLNSGIPHQRLPRTLPRTNGSPFFPKDVVHCGTLNSLPCTVLESSGHHDYVRVSAKPINLSLYPIMTSLSFQGHACGYLHMSVHACRLFVPMHMSVHACRLLVPMHMSVHACRLFVPMHMSVHACRLLVPMHMSVHACRLLVCL